MRIDTKISILVALGVLDSPVSVKQDINKYFVEIDLKILFTMGVNFQIIAAVVEENRILWPLKGENTLHKHPLKGALQICV